MTVRAVAAKRIASLGRVLSSIEDWFGDQVTLQICRHHRRRLRRIGWSRALEPPAGGWAAGEPPMRPGNTISKAQLELRNEGQPLTHRLILLPNVSRRSGRALGPLTGVVVDG